MPRQAIPLTNVKIRSLKPTEKPYRHFDGKGLYLEVNPNGSRYWRHKYSFEGKEKRRSLGTFPDVSLAEAREVHRKDRELIRQGIDPAAKIEVAPNFKAVCELWLDKRKRGVIAEDTLANIESKIKLHLSPLDSIPIDKITGKVILEQIHKLETAGKYETARKTLHICSQVIRFAVASQIIPHDITSGLNGALSQRPKTKHHTAIIERESFGNLLINVTNYTGTFETICALELIARTFVRSGEIRRADWSEFDLRERVWTVPATKMKAKREHVVPLSTQCLEILENLQRLNGNSGFLFPSIRTKSRPMSENTLTVALRNMGYTKEQMTAHGFRTSASTFLNNSGQFSPDAIERQLAHGERNAVRDAYNRADYLSERVEMMQWWSDECDAMMLEAL